MMMILESSKHRLNKPPNTNHNKNNNNKHRTATTVRNKTTATTTTTTMSNSSYHHRNSKTVVTTNDKKRRTHNNNNNNIKINHRYKILIWFGLTILIAFISIRIHYQTIVEQTIVQQQEQQIHTEDEKLFLMNLPNSTINTPINSGSRIQQQQQQQHIVTTNNNNNNNNNNPLKIALLASFPNSGTSFTLRHVWGTTLKAVATNYKDETIPYLSMSSSNNKTYDRFVQLQDTKTTTNNTNNNNNNTNKGPYWLWTNQKLTKPDQYVLTKTHCTSQLKKLRYSNLQQFSDSCLADSNKKYLNNKYVVTKNNPILYNMTNVKKIIHLIRNPFDNVISRYHCEYNENRTTIKPSKNSSIPFRQFCNETFDKKKHNQINWIPDRYIRTMLRHIPCKSQFISYVLWHNSMFLLYNELYKEQFFPTTVIINNTTTNSTTTTMTTTTTTDNSSNNNNNNNILIIHYDMYETNFNDTSNRILNFLNLTKNDANSNDVLFRKGKKYSNFFTLDERIKIKKAVKRFAIKEVWDEISKYFP